MEARGENVGGEVMNGNGHGETGATNGSAKRKAGDMSGMMKSETPTKKMKSDEDEEDDDDEGDDEG